ncbi:MAG: FIG00387823: hypothetical protein [uncultured Sulfurovum sp.]|uniref:Uncharacterized protein n=1 Tax=uncultured Sulfurovum sp. TaxID=269237 RepID=A0A6S6UB78_9BACT|nr:MAG: FIG00387823: hypothetical protein [uncultured Sulfurovum sp.]
MKKMKKTIFIFIILLGICLGGWYYSVSFAVQTRYDFYHWTFKYEVEEAQLSPRYIKVLDISFNTNLDIRRTLFKTQPTKMLVPVIYIDNPLWSKMKAETMVKKVLKALETMPISYREIQVDCDWTDSTKASYFDFLKLLKKESIKKISATIRLHQVKYYTQTGVPPVDYGVLMYYNMSDFKDLKTKNYILDLELAQRYHYNFDDYPLRLNLALPLYSQGTIIRFEEVVGIIEGIRENALNEYFKKVKNHYYKITKTHYFKGRLLYEGDLIRIDEVSKKVLEESLWRLKKVMPKPEEIVFYRWGNRALYGEEFFKKLIEKW